MARARDAVGAGLGQVAGAPVPDFLVQGWADAPAVTLRTLQRAFERQRIHQTLLTGLPGYTKGPRDAGGRLHGPLPDVARDRAAAGAAAIAPMRIERFAAERFAPWVAWYNTQRPHSALAGHTPAQAWADDATAVQRLDAAQLRHLLLAAVVLPLYRTRSRRSQDSNLSLNKVDAHLPDASGGRTVALFWVSEVSEASCWIDQVVYESVW